MRSCGEASFLVLLAVAGCAAPAPRIAGPTPLDGDALPPSPPSAAARRTAIGRSVEGRDIDLVEIGAGPEVVLIFGAFHGDEGQSAVIADRLGEALIARGSVPPDRTVAIVSRLNPDGLAAGTRANARGVDLNRNLPAANWRPARAGSGGAHGPMPGSEPETRIVMALIARYRPLLIISIHTIGRRGSCVNFDGPAEAIARRLSERCGYPLRPTMGYETLGSLGSYAGIDWRIPTITVELPREQSAEASWEDVGEALIEAATGAGQSGGGSARSERNGCPSATAAIPHPSESTAATYPFTGRSASAIASAAAASAALGSHRVHAARVRGNPRAAIASAQRSASVPAVAAAAPVAPNRGIRKIFAAMFAAAQMPAIAAYAVTFPRTMRSWVSR